MNVYYYYILLSLIVELIIILTISYKMKNKLLPMSGMVISMTFAMNAGLTMGVLFGSLYQGNLFYSTIISMLIGMVLGFICGVGLGLLPSIEGTFSGLMGGMMGAMLGEMIQGTQSSIMLIILLTLSLCPLMLFLILPKRQHKLSQINNGFWFFKPLTIIAALSSYLLFGFHLSKDVARKNLFDNQLLEQNEANITINMNEFKYSPAIISVKEGQQITLVLNNFGLN